MWRYILVQLWFACTLRHYVSVMNRAIQICNHLQNVLKTSFANFYGCIMEAWNYPQANALIIKRELIMPFFGLNLLR